MTRAAGATGEGLRDKGSDTIGGWRMRLFEPRSQELAQRLFDRAIQGILLLGLMVDKRVALLR